MHNQEQLLTHFNFISGLKNAGFSMRQITEDVNQKFKCKIEPRRLRHFIDKVNNKTIHSEYNNIIMFDITRDVWDKNLSKFCFGLHGLLITYKNLANLTDNEYIITPDNLINLVSNKESLLYAKRILKLYHINDEILIDQHRKCWPKQPEINLVEALERIHLSFNDEFNEMLIRLHNLYLNFLLTNPTGGHNAQTKNV